MQGNMTLGYKNKFSPPMNFGSWKPQEKKKIEQVQEYVKNSDWFKDMKPKRPRRTHSADRLKQKDEEIQTA